MRSAGPAAALRGWTWARLARISGGLALGALLAAQPVACLHARALTTYVDGAARRTPRPEELRLGEKLRVLATGVVLARPRARTRPDARGLAYETVAVPGELGPLECWLLPAGGGRGRAFLFPGHGGAKDALLDEAAELVALGWDAVLVDFRGCGGSPGRHTTLGWDEARDVADAVAALRRGPTVLYGQSMGAAAVLRAVAVHGLAVDGIVLEAPFDTLLGAVRRRFEAMGLPPVLLPELLVLWGGVLRGFDGFSHRPVDDARAVRSPALVLRGAGDARVRAEDARAVTAALGGPARLLELEGVGHGPCLRAAPAAWRAGVGAFLADLRRSGR